MTRFQKLALLIGALILVAVLALVIVTLTRPTTTDVLAVNEATQTAAFVLGAPQASIDFGNTLAAATQTLPTGLDMFYTQSAIELTASRVVEQNMTVESQLSATYMAATATAQVASP